MDLKGVFIVIMMFVHVSSFADFQEDKQSIVDNTLAPNIIFILTDDLGYGDIGILFQNARAKKGKPYHRTPNLDKLAEEGIILTRHYAPAPVCAPSRASLLLGVHQGHANVRNNQFDKALSNNHTIPSVLKEAGYATGLIGKWGLQGLDGNSPETWEAFPTKRGFDHFFGYVRHLDGHNHYPAHEVRERPPMKLYDGTNEISDQLKGVYTTDLFTAAAKKWIIDHEQKNPDQPFFLELAYDTPHAGLEVAASPYPDGGGLSGGVKWIGKSGRFINTAEEGIDDYLHSDYSSKDWPVQYKRFASMVRRIDNAVGDIMQLLIDLKIDNETMVIFTSDNGPHNVSFGYGDYEPTFFDNYGPLEGIKRDLWEGGIRVPTFIRWPGQVASGLINDTPSGFHDWLPTFTELAGIPAPAVTDGISLVPILKRTGSRQPGVMYIEYKHPGSTPAFSNFGFQRKGKTRGEMQVIYMDGYKGIRYDIQNEDDDFEIYDTHNDSKELEDLAKSSGYFTNLQQRMKDRVLQVRRIDTTAPRPYDQAPVPSITPREKRPGLKYKIYGVDTPWVPDVSTLLEAPLESGVVNNLSRPSPLDMNKRIVAYTGMIKVPKTGTYTFTLQANQGAVLRLHDAVIIDADKGYRSGSAISSSVNLEQGYHPLNLIYSRGKEREPFLQLYWKGPNFEQTPLHSSNLFH